VSFGHAGSQTSRTSSHFEEEEKKTKQRAGVRLRLEVIGAGVTQESFPS